MINRFLLFLFHLQAQRNFRQCLKIIRVLIRHPFLHLLTIYHPLLRLLHHLLLLWTTALFTHHRLMVDGSHNLNLKAVLGGVAAVAVAGMAMAVTAVVTEVVAAGGVTVVVIAASIVVAIVATAVIVKVAVAAAAGGVVVAAVAEATVEMAVVVAAIVKVVAAVAADIVKVAKTTTTNCLCGEAASFSPRLVGAEQGLDKSMPEL